MLLGGEVFGRWLGLDEVMRGKPPWWGETRALPSLYLPFEIMVRSSHVRAPSAGYHQNLIILAPWSQIFQPPELWELNVYRLSRPVYGILLEQPKQTEIGLVAISENIQILWSFGKTLATGELNWMWHSSFHPNINIMMESAKVLFSWVHRPWNILLPKDQTLIRQGVTQAVGKVGEMFIWSCYMQISVKPASMRPHKF